MVNEQFVVGLCLDGASDSLSVLRSELKRTQDKEIEGALKKSDPIIFSVLVRHSAGVWLRLGRMSTQVGQRSRSG